MVFLVLCYAAYFIYSDCLIEGLHINSCNLQIEFSLQLSKHLHAVRCLNLVRFKWDSSYHKYWYAADLHGTLFDFIYRCSDFHFLFYLKWANYSKGWKSCCEDGRGSLMEWMFTLNSQVLIYYFLFWCCSEQVCEREPQNRRQNKYYSPPPQGNFW